MIRRSFANIDLKDFQVFKLPVLPVFYHSSERVSISSGKATLMQLWSCFWAAAGAGAGTGAGPGVGAGLSRSTIELGADARAEFSLGLHRVGV